ncbi:hypothetical protein DTO212C5_3375 [Paecilomyces variotii]|nr:hypothetical protein DTO212C5_3375 [Paecilomyces variotii]
MDRLEARDEQVVSQALIELLDALTINIPDVKCGWSIARCLGPKVTGIDLSTLDSYDLILSQWAALWLSDLSIFTYLIRLLKDHPKVLPVFDIDTLTDPVLKGINGLGTKTNGLEEDERKNHQALIFQTMLLTTDIDYLLSTT